MFYDSIVFKPLHRNNHDAEPCRLEEARGQLLRMMEPQLREMVGEEICILRLDGRYHIRGLDSD
jgi:hypothetical protein